MVSKYVNDDFDLHGMNQDHDITSNAQIDEIFSRVYGEGAITSQEYYSAGEEVLIGTWKENGTTYDLCRKVIYREGAFGNNLIIDPEIPDCEFIVHVDGFIWRQDGYAYGIPSKDLRIGFTADKKLQITIDGDYSAFTKQRIVIEFTRARG